MKRIAVLTAFLLVCCLLTACAVTTQSSKTQAYRGVKYGTEKSAIETMEEKNNSYLQSFQVPDMLSYYIEMSDGYADLSYSFKNARATELHIYSCVPYWGFSMPQHIQNNYLLPDKLYDSLVNELTNLYGKPRIEIDKVIWETQYETIEGSIKDWESHSGDVGGKIVDENGKEVSSVSGRRSDFWFYLKES